MGFYGVGSKNDAVRGPVWRFSVSRWVLIPLLHQNAHNVRLRLFLVLCARVAGLAAARRTISSGGVPPSRGAVGSGRISGEIWATPRPERTRSHAGRVASGERREWATGYR